MQNKFDREKQALIKRAINASLVATVVYCGVFVWSSVSSQRTAARVEQAQQSALQLSERKLDALEREAARDAAARAFAQKQAAEREARTRADSAQAQAQAARL